MKDRFYITSPFGSDGSNTVFLSNSGDYTSNINKAKSLTLEAVNDLVAGGLREGDTLELPLSADHVDELCRLRVKKSSLSFVSSYDEDGEYVIAIHDICDGDDVQFLSMNCKVFDYDKAYVFSYKQAVIVASSITSAKFHSKNMVDSVAIRTFPFEKINKRKMIQGAGVVGIKKKRTSLSKENYRLNCPECGQINWQEIPGYFLGCANVNCSENIENEIRLSII